MILQVDAGGKLKCVCGQDVPLSLRKSHLLKHPADQQKGFMAAVFAVAIEVLPGGGPEPDDWRYLNDRFYVVFIEEEQYEQPQIWTRLR